MYYENKPGIFLNIEINEPNDLHFVTGFSARATTTTHGNHSRRAGKYYCFSYSLYELTINVYNARFFTTH